MYPTRKKADEILQEAETMNPGPWISHSRVTAKCAEMIARCSDLDPEKAYVLGLLHDIGRRYGNGQLRHVYDGYRYMMLLGFDEVARICLTHSFNGKRLEEYPGKIDTAPKETQFIISELNKAEYDDYDRLIQLCDAVSGPDGVMDIVDRMSDVKSRYGSYDQQKWNMNLELKAYFEEKTGRELSELI